MTLIEVICLSIFCTVILGAVLFVMIWDIIDTIQTNRAIRHIHEQFEAGVKKVEEKLKCEDTLSSSKK